MKRLFFDSKGRRARLAVCLFAFVSLSLTLMLVFEDGDDPGGMLFASEALAATESQAPAPKTLSSQPDESTFNEALESVFKSDPLQSLANALQRKESELQERESALAEKERNLETLRLETQQTLERIEQVHRQMESLAANADQQRQWELKKWILIFQKMTPEKVAPVMIDLETDFQLELIGQMEPTKAAKILNAFPPDKAAELSRRLNR
jgi:flagellar motility protein MotE (MotC chaperone)